MKRLISILAILVLTGCSTVETMWDSYFMAKFDSIEYQYLVKIRTEAQTANCADRASMEQTANVIYKTAIELKNYSEFIPRNTDSFNLTIKMVNEAKTLKERYDSKEHVNEAYCTNKVKVVERSVTEIQKVFGSKPR